MDITVNLRSQKEVLLSYFRNRSNEILSELAIQYSATDFKKKASAFNRAIISSKETLLSSLLQVSHNERWSSQDMLECVLMITYTNYVVMLEKRNSIWEYDYMSFSRRIGELWEPFCKLCFTYPLRGIRTYVPPLFSNVQRELTTEITTYIDQLNIQPDERVKLKRYYDKVWGLVTSGEIKLECDLHFSDGDIKYVVDFKSGFGSNEKGNTNRLLLVGSIYRNIETELYKCLIFVRSTENNNYLTILSSSGLWDTTCGIDAYTKIHQFTGYDIYQWINENIDWMNDFSVEMREVVVRKRLGEYLIW